MNGLKDLSALCFVEKGDFANRLRDILSQAGIFRIHEAFDGSEALSIIEKADINAVFIDDDIENTDGVEFTRMLRMDKNSPNQEVIIFLLSGVPSQSRVIEAISSGVHEFILKPSMERKLIRRLVLNVTQPRTFIRAPNYVGPDRRTEAAYKYRGAERRAADEEQPAEAS